jgi:hypothetical protein
MIRMLVLMTFVIVTMDANTMKLIARITIYVLETYVVKITDVIMPPSVAMITTLAL